MRHSRDLPNDQVNAIAEEVRQQLQVLCKGVELKHKLCSECTIALVTSVMDAIYENLVNDVASEQVELANAAIATKH